MGRYILTIGLLLAALAVGLTLLQRFMRPKPPSFTRITVPSVPSIRGKPAPHFELPDLEGRKVQPSDFKNKVLLVNFWATWCGPCIIEIPWFIEFQNKYGPQGLQVIGISLDETGPEDVKPFVQKHRMTYPILMGDESVAQQFGGIRGLPTTFLVDRNGKYYAMHRGLVNRENMEEELQEVLAIPASGAAARQTNPAEQVSRQGS